MAITPLGYSLPNNTAAAAHKLSVGTLASISSSLFYLVSGGSHRAAECPRRQPPSQVHFAEFMLYRLPAAYAVKRVRGEDGVEGRKKAQSF